MQGELPLPRHAARDESVACTSHRRTTSKYHRREMAIENVVGQAARVTRGTDGPTALELDEITFGYEPHDPEVMPPPPSDDAKEEYVCVGPSVNVTLWSRPQACITDDTMSESYV